MRETDAVPQLGVFGVVEFGELLDRPHGQHHEVAGGVGEGVEHGEDPLSSPKDQRVAVGIPGVQDRLEQGLVVGDVEHRSLVVDTLDVAPWT